MIQITTTQRAQSMCLELEICQISLEFGQKETSRVLSTLRIRNNLYILMVINHLLAYEY